MDLPSLTLAALIPFSWGEGWAVTGSTALYNINIQTMQKTSSLARHGDLVFTRSTKPKTKAQKARSYVLAEGEFTGHKHTVTALEKDQMVNVWREIDKIVIEVPEGGAKIEHEEHEPFIFVKGVYDMVVKREFDPFLEQIKQVQD